VRAVLDESGVAAGLTIRSLRARPVNVPLKRPLQTSGGAVQTAPLVLIDLQTDEGLMGCSYVFVYAPMALGPVVSLLDSRAITRTRPPITAPRPTRTRHRRKQRRLVESA
jgi:L-alanine-DL-glutamate epimerase-like enolase superfamily enzyme